ncbi:MAG: amidohydrolase family protein [Microthrixaceae bacterium]
MTWPRSATRAGSASFASRPSTSCRSARPTTSGATAGSARACPAPSDAAAREVVGADRMMWGSDYPHNEGTFPHTREALRQRFSDVDEAAMRMLLADNAAALYGFDLDALAPIAARVGPTVGELRVPLTELPEDPSEALLR